MPPKYISVETSRHGKERVYFRRNGKRTRIDHPIDSPEFNITYGRLLDGAPAPDPKQKLTEGTLEHLIVSYLDSHDFAQRARSTQDMRRRIYFKMVKDKPEAARASLHQVTPAAIKKGLEKRHAESGPSAAKNWLDAMSMLFAWAVDQEMVEVNPCAGIKRPAQANEAHKAWPPELLEQYRARWPLGTLPRALVDILDQTGLRISDARTLGRQHIRGGMIEIRQQKTKSRVKGRGSNEQGRAVHIPVTSLLQKSLEALDHGHLTFLTQDNGKPFADNVLGQAFKRWREEAGLPSGYTAHGLRHTRATAMAEAGATEFEIMHALGHSSPDMARRYTSQVDSRKMAIQASQKLENCRTQNEVRQSKA